MTSLWECYFVLNYSELHVLESLKSAHASSQCLCAHYSLHIGFDRSRNNRRKDIIKSTEITSINYVNIICYSLLI